jgi:hypothetical protein
MDRLKQAEERLHDVLIRVARSASELVDSAEPANSGRAAPLRYLIDAEVLADLRREIREWSVVSHQYMAATRAAADEPSKPLPSPPSSPTDYHAELVSAGWRVEAERDPAGSYTVRLVNPPSQHEVTRATLTAALQAAWAGESDYESRRIPAPELEDF